MSKLPRDLYKSIKKKNSEELFEYLRQLYSAAYMDGLRDGEEEFDGDLIITDEEALERIGEDAFIKLLGE